MKNNYIRKFSIKCIDFLHEWILLGAWKAYTSGWSEQDFEEARSSQSLTSSIDEFEHCEYDDVETMKELLSPVRYFIWKFLQGR